MWEQQQSVSSVIRVLDSDYHVSTHIPLGQLAKDGLCLSCPVPLRYPSMTLDISLPRKPRTHICCPVELMKYAPHLNMSKRNHLLNTHKYSAASGIDFRFTDI